MQVRDTAPGNGARAGGDGQGHAVTTAQPPAPPPPPPGYRTGDYPRLGGSGSGDSGLRLEPPSAAPRRRLPELVLGIFLVAGCALAAVLLAAAGRERTPALALKGDIDRGHVLSEDDLQTIYIGADADVAHVSPDDEADLVGRAALSNLPDGALLTLDQFADPDAVLQSGDAKIGLSLEPGQLPSLDLAPGDRVLVVAGSGTGVGSGEEPDVVASNVTVESVRQIKDTSGQQERWWVSLRMSESDATNVAMAKASNAGIQLVMVGG